MTKKMTKKEAANYLAGIMHSVAEATELTHIFMPVATLVKEGRKHTYEIQFRFIANWWTKTDYHGTYMKHVVSFIENKIIRDWGYTVTYPTNDTVKIS